MVFRRDVSHQSASLAKPQATDLSYFTIHMREIRSTWQHSASLGWFNTFTPMRGGKTRVRMEACSFDWHSISVSAQMAILETV